MRPILKYKPRSRKVNPKPGDPLQRFITDAQVPAAMFDRDMCYITVNKAWLQVYNLTDEIIGRNHYDIFPKIPDEWKEIHSRCLAGATETSEGMRVQRADGRINWLKWEARPWYDSCGEIGGIVIFSENITEQKETEFALKQRDAILNAVAFAAKRLLTTFDWEKEMDTILARLGEAARASRTYVFQINKSDRGEVFTGHRFEWCAPDIPAQSDNPDLQNLPMVASGFGRWKNYLSRGDIIHGAVHSFPKDEHDILTAQDIKSLTVIPVFAHEQWWGFIGFDQCEREREWSIAEVDALRTAANVLGSAIERRGAEAELQQSNERFRIIFESAPDAYYISDLKGNFIDGNKRAEDLVGYKREELIGKSFLKLNLLPLSQIPIAAKGLAINALGKPWGPAEFMLRTREGKTITVEICTYPIRLDNKNVVLGIARDITDRLRAEEALRESEERFRTLYENSTLALYRSTPDGRIILANPALVKMLGYSSFEELASKNVESEDIYLDGGRSVFIERIESEGQITGLESEWKRKDGFLLHVRESARAIRDAAGNTMYYDGTVEDITERKRAEEALRESEQQFRLISENVADMISVLDTEGRRLYNNPSYRPILGNLESLRGTNSFEEIHPEDRERIRNIFQETVKSGIGQRTDYRFLLKDGTVRYIESQGSVIRDDHGNVSAVIVVSRDVTEKKQLEKQVLRSQRMESIGTLAAGIAHDLNNILAPILLSVGLIKEKLRDEQSLNILSMLETSAYRGSELVMQVLSFVRGIDGERTIVQVRHLINEIEKIITQTFPKSVSLHVDIAKDLPIISADPTQLHQVLMNLCVNARDAMPHGGEIEIKAESVIVDEHYVRIHSDGKPGRHLCITVTDHGIGMHPSILERIFEPFFTTKEIGKGTGLGLSTVLAIMKSHGGFVNVYSEVGKGSTFRIYLPVHEITGDTHPQEREHIDAGTGELILVVDDEETIREITRTTLETNGYSVITAADGKEALEIFEKEKQKISLAVTDMNMPHMDGLETIRAMQKMKPDVKCIAVSGLKQYENELPEDTVAFLHKPYSSEKFLKTIHEMLGRK